MTAQNKAYKVPLPAGTWSHVYPEGPILVYEGGNNYYLVDLRGWDGNKDTFAGLPSACMGTLDPLLVEGDEDDVDYVYAWPGDPKFNPEVLACIDSDTASYIEAYFGTKTDDDDD